MVYQIWILLVLYVLGLGFIVLFYPKIHFSLCIMSALYWGALFYIFSAVFLSFFGLYTKFIWALISTEIVIFIIMALKRKTVLKTMPWKDNIIWFTLLFFLFSSFFLIFDNRRLSLFTQDSYVYIAQSSHIFNSSSIIAPGAGLFFREAYGISEALMHSLARFILQPVLTLWHPYLWITLYGSFFALLYEFCHQKINNRSASIIFSLLMTIWVGTAGLNWVNGYYIHVHLITATSIFFAFYFFGKMATSDLEETEYGFLGAVSLCVFGFSRVESPILIGLFLAILLGAKAFSRKELFAAFFPPILIEIIWLFFLLFAYFGYDSIFWSDSRIMLALIVYIIFALIGVIFFLNNKLQYLAQKYLTNIVFVLVINFSLLLLISKPNHQIANLIAILLQFFQGEIWGIYWWANLMIYISILFYNHFIQKKNRFPKTMKLIGMMILVYSLVILDLGYFRKSYRMAWSDSASRMFSHISPIIGFYICKYIIYHFPYKNLIKKKAAKSFIQSE